MPSSDCATTSSARGARMARMSRSLPGLLDARTSFTPADPSSDAVFRKPVVLQRLEAERGGVQRQALAQLLFRDEILQHPHAAAVAQAPHLVGVARRVD